MSRLTIYFLVGIAVLGFIGTAKSTERSSCRFCLVDLIKALKPHKYCNIRKLIEGLKVHLRFPGTLTLSVLTRIVESSCSNEECGNDYVPISSLLSLCDTLIGSGILISGEIYLSSWLNICGNIWIPNYNTCHVHPLINIPLLL